MPTTNIVGCNYRLTEDGLILDFKAHGVVRALGDGKDVGRNLIPPLASVHANSPLQNVGHCSIMPTEFSAHHGVNGEPLVWVDGDTEEAGVGVDQPLDISLVQVEQDGRIIEVGQVGHVLAAVILRRVDLGDQLLLVLLGLSGSGTLDDLHLHLVAVGLFNQPFGELLLWVGNIGRPLGVISLGSDPLLDLLGDKEERGRIGIIPLVQDDLRSGHGVLPLKRCDMDVKKQDIPSKLSHLLLGDVVFESDA